MKMIGHDHELMKEKSAFLPVILHNINQKSGHAVRLQNIETIRCDGCDEKCAEFLRS